MQTLLGGIRASSIKLPRNLAVGLLAALVFSVWWTFSPDGLLGKADAVGYAVCHRIDLRSFHLGDRALPLCSRCTGMYLGVLLGFGFYWAQGRARCGGFPSRPLLAVLGLFGAAFAFDGTNSYLHFFPNAPHLYEPSNVLRLITGTLMGLVLASLALPAFNQNAWRTQEARPVLGAFRELGALLAASGVLILAILSENPLILYPLALLSSLGVVLILTTIHATIMLLFLKRENQAASWRDLAGPVAAGLILAVAQIGVIDAVRFALTGTWAGFSF